MVEDSTPLSSMASESADPRAPARPIDDREVITAVLEGDVAAFSVLVRRYQPVVAKTVIGMLGPGDRAEEAGQIAMIKVYRGLSAFRSDASFKTYVTRIAVNTALDELRRQRRWRFWHRTSVDKAVVDPVEGAADPRDLAADSERQQWIQAALSRLKPEFRAVAVLRLVHGYDPAEVSAILKISEGTVYSRLSRARAHLRRFLTEETDNG